MRRTTDQRLSVARLVVTMVTLASAVHNVQMSRVQPEIVKLPTPPALEGTLSTNHWLAKAKRYMENRIVGPVSMVVVNRYIYTGLQNGWVVEIRPNGRIRRILRMSTKSCGTVSMDEGVCGRPLALRADRNQYLIVVDAYKGIYRINPRNGAFRTLVQGSMIVNQKPLGFINDLAVARDGTIFFSSSSAKYNRTNSLDILLEGDSSGRILVYNPREKPPNHVRELVSNLRYASGLQLSRDESYLLIGEGTRAKIHRAWIGNRSQKRGVIETFAENLPGFVGKIRLSPRNTYWVALFGLRSKDSPSLLDLYGDQPDRRRRFLEMKPKAVKAQMSRHSLIVELDVNGNIIRSLHDPHAQQFSSVSEIEEEYGILYLGSLDRKFVGVLDLRRLPPPAVVPVSPGEGGGTSLPGIEEGMGGHTGDNNGPSNDKLEQFLNHVRMNTRSLSGKELQNIVIILVRRLVEAVSEIRRVLAQASELRRDLTSLQEMLPNYDPSGPGTPTTPDPLYDTTTWYDYGGEEGVDSTTMALETTSIPTETTTAEYTDTTSAWETSTATSEATASTTVTAPSFSTSEAPTTTVGS